VNLLNLSLSNLLNPLNPSSLNLLNPCVNL